MSTSYMRFNAANQALMDCFKAVPADQFRAMSLKDQGKFETSTWNWNESVNYLSVIPMNFRISSSTS